MREEVQKLFGRVDTLETGEKVNRLNGQILTDHLTDYIASRDEALADLRARLSKYEQS